MVELVFCIVYHAYAPFSQVLLVDLEIQLVLLLGDQRLDLARVHSVDCLDAGLDDVVSGVEREEAVGAVFALDHRFVPLQLRDLLVNFDVRVFARRFIEDHQRALVDFDRGAPGSVGPAGLLPLEVERSISIGLRGHKNRVVDDVLDLH